MTRRALRAKLPGPFVHDLVYLLARQGFGQHLQVGRRGRRSVMVLPSATGGWLRRVLLGQSGKRECHGGDSDEQRGSDLQEQ